MGNAATTRVIQSGRGGVATARRETGGSVAPVRRKGGGSKPGGAKLAGGPGAVEVQTARRSDHEESLAALAAMVVPKALTDAKGQVHKYLTHGLGIGGAPWYRSKELKAFRAKMKGAARAESYVGVWAEAAKDDNYAEEDDGEAVGAATKAYVQQEGEIRAHRMAKESVDHTLQELSVNWMDLHWDDVAIAQEVEAAVTKAAWDVLAKDPTDQRVRRAAQNAARQTANSQANAVHDRVKAALTAHKNAVIKPTAEQAVGAFESQQALAAEVAKKAEQEEIGLRSVQAAIKANTTDEAIGKFGSLIDMAIPNSGDRVSLSVELQVPIGHSPGFVTFKLSGTAARGTTGAVTSGVTTLGDPRRLEVMGHFQFGAGAEAFGIRGDLTVGLFVRAGANAGTAATMKALNYGWYRAAVGMNTNLAGLWSGSPQGTALGNKERAEAWAAMVEDRVFAKDDSAFADLGGSAGGSVGVNAGPFTAGAAMGGDVFKRYNQAGLKGSLGDSFAQPVTSKAHASERIAKAKGTAMGSFGVSAETEVTINGQKVGFAAGFSMENQTLSQGGADDDWGVEISATLGLGDGTAGAVDKIAAGFVKGALGVAKKLAAKYDAKQKANKKKDAGAGADLLSDIAIIANAGLENKITNALADLWEVESLADNAITDNFDPSAAVSLVPGLSVGSAIQAAITFGKTGGKGVFRFELRSTKSLEVKVGMGNVGLTVSAERGERLFGMGYEDGGFALDVLGTRPVQEAS